MKLHDLRSDFLSPASAAAAEAMAGAAIQPRGFGLREDPEQTALEREVAELLGKEDALLMPTCTMANLVACAAQMAPGDMVVAEAASHCVISEAGGVAAVAGGLVMALPGHDGAMSIQALENLLRRGHDAQSPRIALVVVETTHNRAGGLPLPLRYLQEVAGLTERHGSALHVDGARFLNACLALDIAPHEMAEPATTVSLSLNKGIGAPTGAILAGPAEVIARALVLRQRFGGGLRPAGAIAAAARAALKTYPDRLAADHANAALLANFLAASGFELLSGTPRTNILMLRSQESIASLLTTEALARRGVLGLDFGQGWIRLCLHSGIAASDIAEIGAAIVAAQDARESGT